MNTDMNREQVLDVMIHVVGILDKMQIKPGYKLTILLCLDGGAMSTAAIADRIGMEREQVRKALWDLRKMGYVDKFKPPGSAKNSCYFHELTSECIKTMRSYITGCKV